MHNVVVDVRIRFTADESEMALIANDGLLEFIESSVYLDSDTAVVERLRVGVPDSA